MAAKKKYSCRLCGKKFTSPGAVGAHRRTDHPEPAEMKEKHGIGLKRRVKSELELVSVVQSVWPKGIQTADPDQLFNDLNMLHELRFRMGA